MNPTQTDLTEPVRIPANHAVTKRLGNWTTARRVPGARPPRTAPCWTCAPRRSRPATSRSTSTSTTPCSSCWSPTTRCVDDWDLRRTGRGRVKDAEGPDAAGGRRIVLTGQLRSGEIRVHRGGIAMLSAMFSREYLADLRRAHKEGGFPTVDDPARTA